MVITYFRKARQENMNTVYTSDWLALR